MATAENAASRKLLPGGAIARGVADVGGISFGLWDLVTGFFANILAYLFAALAGVAHMLVLPLELLWQWLVTLVANAAGAISSGLDGLWHHVTGFFAGIFAALASVPHLLVLPLQALWQWLATIVADAAGSISSSLDGLWRLLIGFFAGIFAALAGVAHQLVLPLETICQWIATTAADAAGSISSGLDGLWQLLTGFFPGILAHLSAALAGAAQQLESLWQRLLTNVADAAGAISFYLDGLWQLVAGFFPKILAALAGAAHEIPQKLEELWRWLKAFAVVALPFVVGVAVVILLVAFVWRFWGPAVCAVGVGACALVYAISYLGNVVLSVTVVSVGVVLSCLLPPCAQCLHVITMSAVGVGACQALVNAFRYLLIPCPQCLRDAGDPLIRCVVSSPTPSMTASPSPSNEAAPSPDPPPRPASQSPAVVAEVEDTNLVEDDTEAAGEGVVADCCCVCMAGAKDAAFYPCGHTLCRACARKILASRGLCPLCKAEIIEVLDIF